MRHLLAALLLLLAPAASALPPRVAIQACDDVVWNMAPQVGIANSTSAILAAVPQASAILRARLSTGAFAQTRDGVGGEAIYGGGGGAAPRTGTWASMKNNFTATGAAGENANPNTSVEFLFSGLTPDTQYHYTIEYQCGAGWRPDRRFGKGSFRTWPAAGAAADVRVLLASDTHLTPEYAAWIGTATGCPDLDGDSICDGYEDYLRGLNVLRELSLWATSAHLWLQGGDDAYIHTTGSQTCSTVTSVGPCGSDNNHLDAWNTLMGDDKLPATVGTQLDRPSTVGLGVGNIFNAGGYSTTWFDDQVDKAEARLGVFANRAWIASHNVSSIFHPGNHEAWVNFGQEDCTLISPTVWTHVNCTNAGYEAQQTHKVAREAYRNYWPNPNELWPSGIDETDDDLEEQGAYYTFDLGRVRIININEYIHTTGKDEGGYLFSAGTTIDFNDCVGPDDPFVGCSTAAAFNTSNSQPATPWEWTIGPQLSWALDKINTAPNADVIVVLSHHPIGGIGLTGLYSYGRMPVAAGSRYCQVSGQDATVTRPGFAWLTGSIGNGEKIPCWDGIVGTVDNGDSDERICDFLVDGTNDDDGVCGPLVDKATLWGEEAQIQAALQAACTAGKTAIRLIGHDHLFTATTRGCVHWITLGQSGGQVTAAWAYDGTGTAEFQSYSDGDQDGIPDYAQSPVVEAIKAHGFGLETPPPYGWDGKGFAIMDVDGAGAVRFRFISVPGHEATPTNPDGQVVFDRNL